jgi:hypothetical protein
MDVDGGDGECGKGLRPRGDEIPTMSFRNCSAMLLVVALSCLGGCEQAHTYPSDPIFASRQPSIGQPEPRSPSIVALGQRQDANVPTQPDPQNSSGANQFVTVRGQSPQ